MSTSFFQTRVYLRDFQVDDVHQVRFRESVEDDDLVETIQELRLKDPLGLVEDFVAHHFVGLLVPLPAQIPSSSGA